MADDLIGALTAIIPVVTFPVGVLALFFVSWEVAMVVFVVGWFLLTPLIPIVGEELLPALGSDESSAEAADPLAELKQRYARGEIGDEEFERRIGNLVETEDLDIESDADRDGLADGVDGLDARDLERARE